MAHSWKKLKCGCLLHNDGSRTYCAMHSHRVPNAEIVDPEPDSDPPCPKCGSDLGHRVNCPNGIAFTSGANTAPEPDPEPSYLERAKELQNSVPWYPEQVQASALISIAESLERIAAALEVR